MAEHCRREDNKQWNNNNNNNNNNFIANEATELRSEVASAADL